MQTSYWEWNTYLRNIDTAIIGSGIVGLSAAIYLKTRHPNQRIVIFERGPLPSGASTRNAGFACFGSVTELLDDLDNHTEDAVFALVEQRWRGLQNLRQLIGDQQLGYQTHGAYELFKPDQSTTYEKCLDQLDYLNKNLHHITGTTQTFTTADTALSRFQFGGIQHLIRNHSEGQLHTGNMVAALTRLAQQKGVQILNGVHVTDIHNAPKSVTIYTKKLGRINSRKVLVATNGFTKSLLPELDVTAVRNQVLITQPIPNLHIKGCFHYDKGYVYFRNVGDRILLGGGRHHFRQQETTSEFGTTENVRKYLEDLLYKHILPQSKNIKINRWWSGILGVGKQKTPIVKCLSDNLAVAVRMGGMGVAIGTLMGKKGGEMLWG